MDKAQPVKRCQAGDREAFGILYKTYYPRLREVVAYYIHNDSVAEDILHDGFLIVFSSICTLRNGTKIEAWLTSIMKNLSLQYLKEASCLSVVPVSDATISDKAALDSDEVCGLSWEDIDKIIGRLPEGYGRVFRLAVLDGLSHKEIGEMLGIAPHSSSSQLTHAKAMLRRLISAYRVEIGVLSVVAVILLIWNGVFNQRKEDPAVSLMSRNSDETPSDVIAPIDNVVEPDSITPKPEVTCRTAAVCRYDEKIAEEPVISDGVPQVERDSSSVDTVGLSLDMFDHGVLIAGEYVHRDAKAESTEWSLALAYTGAPGYDGLNSYKLPNPDIPSESGEVIESAHHHMPFVIGISVNKSLSSRWSIESGVRYTLLRSDIISQSEYTNAVAIQRIHYIGLPVKFNYRMFSYNGLSVYGQGGVALDIPISGNQSVRKYSSEWLETEFDRTDIQAPWQWSVEGGIGIQYNITHSFGVYAEPSVRCYFNPGSNVRTIHQEEPVEFTIPVGLRFTW